MDIRISFFYEKLFCKKIPHLSLCGISFIDLCNSDKRTGVLCLIFELMAMNLYEYIRGRQRLLPSDTVCKYMYQLLKSLEYLHR